MFKIIYIPAVTKIKNKKLKDYLKCFFYNFVIIFRNFNLNKKTRPDTSGYIDTALHTNANILELPYSLTIFLSKFLNFFFDGIFINFKFTNSRNKFETYSKLLKLSNKFKIKKVIIDIRDGSKDTISDELIARYDFVIKREKNKSIDNKKYLSTMLPCTNLDYKISKKIENINWNKFGHSIPNNKFKFDIYFSGSLVSKKRADIYNFLQNKNLNLFFNTEKGFNKKQFSDNIYNSRINLALPGHGEFTFRHLEILCNCSFLICDKEINDMELPLPIKDGEDFITYENEKDLLEKINYYLKNDYLRSKIALNGRKQLEKYYSPKNHGENILKKIF